MKRKKSEEEKPAPRVPSSVTAFRHKIAANQLKRSLLPPPRLLTKSRDDRPAAEDTDMGRKSASGSHIVYVGQPSGTTSQATSKSSLRHLSGVHDDVAVFGVPSGHILKVEGEAGRGEIPCVRAVGAVYSFPVMRSADNSS